VCEGFDLAALISATLRAMRRSDKLVQNHRFKALYPLKDWIVGNQTSGLPVYDGRSLKGIGSAQAGRARIRAARSAISRFGAIHSKLG